MSVVLDASALVAIDRRDRGTVAQPRVIQRSGADLRTSAGVVAQVWRHGARQANLARVLSGVELSDLDGADARKVGELLRLSGTADVVDAHVAVMIENGDTVLTADPDDFALLLEARDVETRVLLA